MTKPVSSQNFYLKDTNQDGIFDLHGGDRVYNQDGHVLSVSQVIELDPGLAQSFKVSENNQFAKGFLDQPLFLAQNKTGKATQSFKSPLAGLVALGFLAAGTWFFTKDDDDVSPEAEDGLLLWDIEFPRAMISGSGDDDDDAPEVDDSDERVNEAEEQAVEFSKAGNHVEAAKVFETLAQTAGDLGQHEDAANFYHRASDAWIETETNMQDGVDQNFVNGMEALAKAAEHRALENPLESLDEFGEALRGFLREGLFERAGEVFQCLQSAIDVSGGFEDEDVRSWFNEFIQDANTSVNTGAFENSSRGLGSPEAVVQDLECGAAILLAVLELMQNAEQHLAGDKEGILRSFHEIFRHSLESLRDVANETSGFDNKAFYRIPTTEPGLELDAPAVEQLKQFRLLMVELVGLVRFLREGNDAIDSDLQGPIADVSFAVSASDSVSGDDDDAVDESGTSEVDDDEGWAEKQQHEEEAGRFKEAGDIALQRGTAILAEDQEFAIYLYEKAAELFDKAKLSARRNLALRMAASLGSPRALEALGEYGDAAHIYFQEGQRVLKTGSMSQAKAHFDHAIRLYWLAKESDKVVEVIDFVMANDPVYWKNIHLLILAANTLEQIGANDRAETLRDAVVILSVNEGEPRAVPWEEFINLVAHAGNESEEPSPFSEEKFEEYLEKYDGDIDAALKSLDALPDEKLDFGMAFANHIAQRYKEEDRLIFIKAVSKNADLGMRKLQTSK